MAEFKLSSYNIHRGLNQQKVVENLLYLIDSGAEFFCLQELRQPIPGDKFIGEIILEQLGPNWAGEFFLGEQPDHPDLGLAMLWRKDKFQPTGFQKVLLPKLERLPMFQRIFSQAFLPARGEPIQRGAFLGTFQINGQKVRIINVHLDFHGGFRHRINQLKHLVQHLRFHPHSTAEIICGDFNTLGLLDNSKQMAMVEKALGPEFHNTYPEFRVTTAHFQHLDHVFTRNIKAAQSKVYQRPGSDHFPILVEMNL